MAVTFDANASASVTANAVTSITTSNLTVGAGANRALKVQVIWSGTVASPAMNWDQLGTPQALAAIPGAGATNTCRVEEWGLVAPTSGAKQLSVSWTTARDVYVNQFSYAGVDQGGGATSFPNGAGATAATQPTIAITSNTSNHVSAVHATPTKSFLSVNNTQTFLNNGASTVSGAGNRAAGAATVTLTGTMDAAGPWASAGSDIAAAGTARRFLLGSH